MAMRGEVCGGSGGEFGGGSVALVVAVAMAMAVAVARVRVRALASAMKVAVVAVGREMVAAVVVVVAVVVEVEVEVAVTGGVPFCPPNEIKIESTSPARSGTEPFQICVDANALNHLSVARLKHWVLR